MNEEIQIIYYNIPCERYERQIKNLVDALLIIDEKLFSNESKKNKTEAA